MATNRLKDIALTVFGAAVILALLGWLISSVYLDIYLDVRGTSGYAYVRATTASHGTGSYSYRTYCHFELQVPRSPLADIPDRARSLELRRDARAVQLTTREDEPACAGHAEKWKWFRYDDDDPSNIRAGDDGGIVATAVILGALALALFGVMRLVRAVRQLRRSR